MIKFLRNLANLAEVQIIKCFGINYSERKQKLAAGRLPVIVGAVCKYLHAVVRNTYTSTFNIRRTFTQLKSKDFILDNYLFDFVN